MKSAEVIKNVRKLSNKDLFEIISIFEDCCSCSHEKITKKCKYAQIRKKIGLGECRPIKLKESLKRSEGKK